MAEFTTIQIFSILSFKLYSTEICGSFFFKTKILWPDFSKRYDNELHRFHFRNLISPRTCMTQTKEKNNVIQQQYLKLLVIFINPNYPLMTTCSTIENMESLCIKPHLEIIWHKSRYVWIKWKFTFSTAIQLYKEKENNVEINSILEFY